MRLRSLLGFVLVLRYMEMRYYGKIVKLDLGKEVGLIASSAWGKHRINFNLSELDNCSSFLPKISDLVMFEMEFYEDDTYHAIRVNYVQEDEEHNVKALENKIQEIKTPIELIVNQKKSRRKKIKEDDPTKSKVDIAVEYAEKLASEKLNNPKKPNKKPSFYSEDVFDRGVVVSGGGFGVGKYRKY